MPPSTEGFADADNPFETEDQPDFAPVRQSMDLSATAVFDKAAALLAPLAPDTGAVFATNIVSGAPGITPDVVVAVTSQTFSTARHIIEADNPDELMFVLSAGQSLSRGTTLRDNFEMVWTDTVDASRAFMLDFNHAGFSARGWDYATVDTDRFQGLTPMASGVTETPAPAMVAQILSAYDAAGRIAPNIAHAATGALGASVLELMTSAEDLVRDQAAGLAQTTQGGLFAVATTNGKYDYFVNDSGRAVYLDTHRHEPGLWDTMEMQIALLAEAARMDHKAVHDTAAVGFVHGTADVDLDHPVYGYDWALTRYFDMIESEMRAASGLSDLSVVFAMSQAQGDAEASVPLAQLAVALSDDRVHLATSQFQYRFTYGSDPGIDNRHLSPEGYFHLGQGLGASLGQALTGPADTPLLITSVERHAADTLDVDFSGVTGRLMVDTSLFSPDQGFSAPEFFGFALFDADTGQDIDLIDAWIVDADTVRLVADRDLDDHLRLVLGPHGEVLNPDLPSDALQSFNTVTLRDTVAMASMIAPDGYSGDDMDVFRFAPIQSVDFFV